MKKLLKSQYIKDGLKRKAGFDPLKHCACCRCNGSTRKIWVYFNGNRRARVCRSCILRLDSQALVTWLTKSAIYEKTPRNLIRRLVDFKPILWDKVNPSFLAQEILEKSMVKNKGFSKRK